MSFISFLCANLLTFSIFTTAFTTCYSFCRMYDIPFCNLNKISEDVVKLKHNSIQLYFGSIYMIMTCSYFIDLDSHSFSQSVLNIVQYTLLIECLFHTYYRFLYKNTPFLQNIHSVEYPIDVLMMDVFQLSCYFTCLHIPAFLLKVNMYEYAFMVSSYTSIGILTRLPTHVPLWQMYDKSSYIYFPVFPYLYDNLYDFHQEMIHKKTDNVIPDVLEPVKLDTTQESSIDNMIESFNDMNLNNSDSEKEEIIDSYEITNVDNVVSSE